MNGFGKIDGTGAIKRSPPRPRPAHTVGLTPFTARGQAVVRARRFRGGGRGGGGRTWRWRRRKQSTSP